MYVDYLFDLVRSLGGNVISRSGLILEAVNWGNVTYLRTFVVVATVAAGTCPR